MEIYRYPTAAIATMPLINPCFQYLGNKAAKPAEVTNQILANIMAKILDWLCSGKPKQAVESKAAM
jgi:hypothetical protein